MAGFSSSFFAMLNVKCPSCGATYQLSDDLYQRKAAGFGVVVTCRKCKSEIHVESTTDADADAPPRPAAPTPEQLEIQSPVARGAPGFSGSTPAGRPKPPVRSKDPASGPFVALSPGLLGAGRPESAPDSELPVDSSDFLGEPKKALPKAPPVKRFLPSGLGEPQPDVLPSATGTPRMETLVDGPAIPRKQKKPARPPTRSDFTDDLLSADVGFDRPPGADSPAPRLVAPDAAALLTAPAPELVPGAVESPGPPPAAPGASPSPAPSSAEVTARASEGKKPSRAILYAVLALGVAGGLGLALRGKLAGPAAPAPADTHAAAPSPLPVEPPTLAPTSESAPAEPIPSASAEPAPALQPTAASAAPTTTRATSTTAPATTAKGESLTTPTPKASARPTASPGATAPPPGAAAAPEPTSKEPAGPFDAAAARTALAGAVAQASGCRKPGDPSGVAVVTITFSPSGRVTTANIAGPPFAGTPTGGCIASTLRRARVPAFTGDLVTVKKTVEIQ